MKIDQILEKLCNKEISIQECMQLIISDMEEKSKNKAVEFEVEDIGYDTENNNRFLLLSTKSSYAELEDKFPTNCKVLVFPTQIDLKQ